MSAVIKSLRRFISGRKGLNDQRKRNCKCDFAVPVIDFISVYTFKPTAMNTEKMKRTPFSYLNQYRIERSCELLVNTDLSISDIALRAGFNSFSYYSKRFRKIMHCTPSEYRLKIQNAITE